MHIEPKIILSAPSQMPGDYITSIVFLKNRGMLASTSRWSNIMLWDLEGGQIVQSIQGRSESWKIAASTDERFLALASDRGVQICDISAEVVLHDLDSRLSSIRAIAFDPEINMMAYGTREPGKSVEIRDLEASRTVTQIGHSHPVDYVSFSPNGTMLATYSNSELFFWEVWGPNLIDSTHRLVAETWRVALSRDWRFMATLENHSIGLWELVSDVNVSFRGLRPQKLKELRTPDWGYTVTNALTFSPDGAMLATGSASGTYFVFDLVDGSVFKARNSDITASEIAFSHDSRMLAACGATRAPNQELMIQLWSLSR
jgi:WD40 repeat protein